MASPPFNISETLPEDDDVVSQFPGIERTFRDVVESWLLIDGNVNGRHDKLSLDEVLVDPTFATDVAGLWNRLGVLKYRDAGGAVTNVITDASLYALLASPTFTGNPAAPTPSTGDNDTSIATTAFVQTTVAASGGLDLTGLVITVASNTTVGVVASDVVVTDGSTFLHTGAINVTVNLGSNGAINKLDTGTIAIDSEYHLWAITGTGQTAGVIASLSTTTPALPSGYTHKRRLGAVLTIHASATLYGTIQKGRRAQFVVGLAQTTVSPKVTSGIATTFSTTSPSLTSVSLSTFIPTTAAVAHLLIGHQYQNGTQSNILVAPNTSWGGTNRGPAGSAGQIWPYYFPSQSLSNSIMSIVLEALSVAWASDAAGGAISVLGWDDNI